MSTWAFTKMHGLGNDYITIDGIERSVDFDPAVAARQLSRRGFSIGADGLVLILPGEAGGDFRMRIFNADGSEARMCGNASRCVGKYLYERGRTNKTLIRLETNSGVKELRLHLAGDESRVAQVGVDMGEPVFSLARVPADLPGEEWIEKEVKYSGFSERATVLSMGNPHVVFRTDAMLSELELSEYGQAMVACGYFPEGVNTEVLQVHDRQTLAMRVWERGSGETLACGSGACAAVVAAIRNGWVERGVPVAVRLRGGDLCICWQYDGRVIMVGDAAFSYEGTVEIDTISLAQERNL